MKQRKSKVSLQEETKAFKDYRQARDKNRKWVVDGIYVYLITTYDDELLDRLQALREEDERRKAEEEKEKKKQPQ